MPDETKREEIVLEKLSAVVRKGWAEKHPLTQRHLSVVRNALEKGKTLSQEERRKMAVEKVKKLAEELKQGQERTQSQERTRSR